VKKKNLYIDFDGVILDTIPPLYDSIKKHDMELYNRNINHTTSPDDVNKILNLFSNVDWHDLLNVTPEINNSIKKINDLIENNLYNITILTHVSSFGEMEAKFDFISNKICGEIDIICVPKRFDKSVATRTCKDCILVDDHTENLRRWEKAGGIGIKFTDKKKEDFPFYQINSLDQIPSIINKIESQNN
jgi:hypothetical protein